jgi:hypothetical protein
MGDGAKSEPLERIYPNSVGMSSRSSAGRGSAFDLALVLHSPAQTDDGGSEDAPRSPLLTPEFWPLAPLRITSIPTSESGPVRR